MSYHCGIGPGIPDMAPRPPHVTCDGCGRVVEVITKRGLPTMWFLANKAPPRWKLVRDDDGTRLFRRDYCDKCKVGK